MVRSEITSARPTNRIDDISGERRLGFSFRQRKTADFVTLVASSEPNQALPQRPRHSFGAGSCSELREHRRHVDQ